ncbi:elongation factor P maturation arginine rhamnosyltransferase EarP [Kingella bonacorsii]|uniref:Protein-arginine rhamnosyltransferase n=1 Tax=Kingella bonacorsii TaxID=2796361 RepID=A0ABS1BUB0_9NEIS|nr:elongation factor P maturation arginine rhamnosyltransferase EarP [Kingella bonacorsii]MBK0396832.1 elongation factor P maturation arginine rhamnosyltransferase EarP [Kingella bonacorsii]
MDKNKPRYSTAKPFTCWLFCTVIDNFGDIGVSWRLAQALRQRLGWQVHLWLDNLAALQAIAPDAPAVLPCVHQGIRLHAWQEAQHADLDNAPAPDLVMETFACALPPNVHAIIQTHRPVWLNWEYLSAEDWAIRTHTMPSLQANGCEKYFWQMGFVPESGGLLREADYVEQMDAFKQRQPENTPSLKTAALHIFAFGYASDVWQKWVAALAEQEREIVLHCAGKPLQTSLSAWGNVSGSLKTANSNDTPPARTLGSLKIINQNFVPQAQFDRALWAADVLIVRGEDSFVRAQLAGKPFFWHIYPQAQAAHLDKLNAFWRTHHQHAAPTAAVQHAHQALSNDLNGAADLTSAQRRQHWRTLLAHLADWQRSARAWQQYLLSQNDAVSRLRDWLHRLNRI